MATAVEAVIISGPRKGEIVRLDGDVVSSPAVEQALDVAIGAAEALAANVRAMREQTEAFVAELRQRRLAGGVDEGLRIVPKGRNSPAPSSSRYENASADRRRERRGTGAAGKDTYT